MRQIYSVLSIIIFTFLSTVLVGQEDRGGGRMPQLKPGTGAIAGIAFDTQTDAAVPFANVAVYNAENGELQDGTVTNEKGRFMIKDLAFGSYYLLISFLGYEDLKKEDVNISAETPFVRFGRLNLSTASQSLETVEVTAEKNEITFGLDKKTFNVEKQLNSTGGTAEDVLRNIPSVSFDVNGNVSLRGSSNIRIFINGKPSAITGGGRTAVLDQIPAASIKDVEVMTNPNAKFDPDGTGGIINIITKKQNRQGFNTRIALNLGTRNKYDGSVNLNYRVGKFNTFLNYAGRYGEYFGERISNRTQVFADTAFTRNTISRNDRIRTSHNIQFGTEYYFSPKASLTGSVTFNPGSRESFDRAFTDFFDAERVLTDYSQTVGMSEETETDLEYNLDFTKSMKKEGQKFSFGARYSTSTEVEDEFSDEQFFNTDDVNYNFFGNTTIEDESFRRLRIQADYEHPFENGIKLETGLQTNIQQIDNDYIFDGLDEVSKTYQLSNRFIYDEAVHAAYAIFTGKKGKFSWSGGLRAEQAYTQAVLIDTEEEPFNNPYFRLYPSGSVSFKTGESTTLQASYSRRVNRPRARSLNPFLQVRDSLNFRRGNPELLPEFINSYEVNYLITKQKGTITAGVFFRQTDDVISRLQDIDNTTGIVTSTWVNLASSRNYGVELIGTYRPSRKVAITANVSFFRAVVDGNNLETDLTNSGNLMTGRLSANFTILKDLDLQITGFGRSPGVSVQGTYRGVFTADFALKKPILKGKGALTFRLSDIFDTRDFEIDLVRPGLDQYFKFKRESRIAFIGFSYSLRQEKRRRGGGRPNRGGGSGGGGGFDY